MADSIQRNWTVMIYLAGDNDLSSLGLRDIDTLKQLGSTDEVELIAQIDPAGKQPTRRFAFHNRNERPNRHDVVISIPETNTGDPQTLLDFALWSIEKYPAKHYAFIIWGHGSGWDNGDACLDNPNRSHPQTTKERNRAGGLASDHNSGGTRSHYDSLTTDELTEVFREVKHRRGCRLGVDHSR